MLAFNIAKRFIISSKFQAVGIVLGIAVGVSVQIFIGILIDSLQQSLVNKTIGSSPQITVTSEEGYFDMSAETIDSIASKEGVTIARSSIDINSILLSDSKSYPLLLRGLELGEGSIYKLEDKLDGDTPKSGEILIGKDLYEKIGANKGEELSLSLSSGKVEKLRVSGVFDLKNSNLNTSWGIVNQATAGRIIGHSGSVSSLEIQVADVFMADTIAEELKTSLPNDLEITNWKDQNSELLNALSSQSLSSYMIQVFVLLSVVIAISSVLSVSVVQKSRQIGILKAMGATDRTAGMIFTFQSLMLGTIGALVGTGLGMLLFFAFNTFAKNPDGSAVVEAFIRWPYLIATVFIVIIFATLSGLPPSMKSKKLSPIEIIRGN